MQNELALQPYDLTQQEIALYPRCLLLGHRNKPYSPPHPGLCRLVMKLDLGTATLDVALVPTVAQK